MKLNERKLNILKAIVKDYIETAEAVGSRTISKKHDLGISAATIRNEMADLEELGYLIQPHTSAGRVPSEKGYKLYVDMLMGKSELSNEEKKLIQDCIQKSLNHKNVIKHIQLVSIDENKILLIVVTNNGDIKKADLTSDIYLDQSKLNIISDNLTRKLLGKSIVEIDERLIAFIKYEIGEYSNLIDGLIDALNYNMSEEEAVFSLNGATNIFNYP